MFNRKTKALNVFFQTTFEALCNLISEWEDYQYYAEKLNKMIGNYCEHATRAFDCDEGDLAVLVRDIYILTALVTHLSEARVKF